MKYCAIILSLFFLALNFVPCADNGAHSSSGNEQIVENQHNSSEHADMCSPFCQCHCCHIHYIDFALASTQFIHPEISTAIFGHFNNIGKEIPHSFLQPPRV